MQCYCCLPISSDRSRIFVWYDTVWHKRVWYKTVCCIFVWFPFQCSVDTWPVSTICGQQKQSALFLIVFKQFLRRFWKILSLQSQCPILNDVVSFDRSSFCYHEAQAYHSAVIFCFFNQTGSSQQDNYNREQLTQLAQLIATFRNIPTSQDILGGKFELSHAQ